MSSSSEIRWLVFGVFGLTLVGGAYAAFQLVSPDADVEPVAALPDPVAPTPAAPIPTPVAPTPAVPPPPPTPTPLPTPIAPPMDAPLEVVAPTAPSAPVAPADPMAVYRGTHKLGVNRVTDMARTGNVTFDKRDGKLHLEGRVQRGQHWLSISGTVEPKSPQEFTLNGTIKGVPNMAWNNEAPRERSTNGRFTFRVKSNRPYWRLYEVDGRDCVCWDNCGNDFCYIDIERNPNP